MRLLSHISLRQMLTLPYVLLVILAAMVIGALSYGAGRNAVDTLSDQLLTETVNRVAQAVEKHIAGSEAVLETAFPTGLAAPRSIADELDIVRTRLWMATTIHRDPNNYAYYGDRRGHFIGLLRISADEAELRLRTHQTSPRAIYRYATIGGKLTDAQHEERLFDPRERPWFKTAQGASNQVWTSVYIDFRTQELVATRAKRINSADGAFEGVAGTDLSLRHLGDFLRTLKISDNGFAFIVEPDGNLLATSRGPHLRKGAMGVEGGSERLNAANSDDLWIAKTHAHVLSLIGRTSAPVSARTASFQGPGGEAMQAGYARLRDRAGLDWIIAVAAPRSDFLGQITANVQRTALMALAACVLIVLTGFAVLHVIARQLRDLARAARDLGEGQMTAIPVDRTDEIGDLAKSFAYMQERLLTDALTGIANREAITRRIEDRLLRRRRHGDQFPFAVLYADLNGFKQINDQHGHDIGDQVLIEIAQRLRAVLRDSDLAARFGGDEFVALLDHVGHPDQAEAARDKMERALAEPLNALAPFGAQAAGLGAGAAIGMALCPEHGHDLETLLKHADADMYSRKQARTDAR